MRAYGTRNHTSGFTGGLGQNETPAAFGDTENFLNEGISVVFSLNTVMGRKVNELRVSVAAENRARHAADGFQQTNLIGPGLIGERYYLPINGENDKLQIADNFSYSFGKHDMKFGGDSDTFEDRKDTFVGWSTGQYEFSLLDSFSDDLAAFQSGVPNALIQDLGLNNTPLFNAGTLYPNYLTGIGLYWQDKWTITPRITLTYGLRRPLSPETKRIRGSARAARPFRYRSASRMTLASGDRVSGWRGMWVERKIRRSFARRGDTTTL